MKTLLQLIQSSVTELGLTSPTSVVGNQDTQVVQFLSLLNAVGRELRRVHDWQALEVEYRFTTQYLITTGNTTSGSAVVTGIPSTTGLDTTYQVTGVGVNQDTWIKSVDSATQVTLSQQSTITGTPTLSFGKTKYALPSDFDRIVDRTQYDKSKRWEMLGPQTAQQWQFLKSSYIATGPRMRYRLLGGFFQIWPVIATPEYLGMEYVSSSWVNSAAGVAQTDFLADTDTCIFPDDLVIVALKRKFYQAKGFDPIFDTEYEALLSIAQANDGGSPTLSLAPQVSSVLVGYENIPDSGYGY